MKDAKEILKLRQAQIMMKEKLQEATKANPEKCGGMAISLLEFFNKENQKFNEILAGLESEFSSKK